MKRSFALAFLAVILAIILLSAYFFLSERGGAQITIRAGTLQGGISTLDPMQYYNLSSRENVKLEVYRFEKTTDILAALGRGDIDVAVIPSEMAAKLIQSGIQVKIIAPEMLQNQAILTRGDMSSIEQLRGKNVISLLSTGSYMMFKAYMKIIYNMTVVDSQQGSGDIVGINSPPGTILDALARGDGAAAVVWEPFVSIGVVRYNFTVLSTFQQLWDKTNSTGLPVMLVWVATQNFTSDSNKLKAFLNMRSLALEEWKSDSNGIVKMMRDMYGLSQQEASYLYNRVALLDNSLNATVRSGIRNVWYLAYRGGYLNQDPSSIGDQAFYAAS
ncbi:MAG: ABC transporter substrate-binding protein [Fervidicoccaceae archaeon]